MKRRGKEEGKKIWMKYIRIKEGISQRNKDWRKYGGKEDKRKKIIKEWKKKWRKLRKKDTRKEGRN